jgi:hypothetical protein
MAKRRAVFSTNDKMPLPDQIRQSDHPAPSKTLTKRSLGMVVKKDSKSDNTAVTTTTIKKKSKIEKPVIYLEFIDAAELTDDAYWKQQLNLAARGTFTGKVTYDGTSLSKKDPPVKKRLPKDSKQLANAFINFYKAFGHVMSNTDTENQEKERLEYISQVITLDWQTCSKATKKMQLLLYASKLANLSPDISPIRREIIKRELSGIFLVALDYGMLTSGTVYMENNAIEEITCLKYSKVYDRWWMDTSISKPNVKKITEESTEKHLTLLEEWNTLLKIYKKEYT